MVISMKKEIVVENILYILNQKIPEAGDIAITKDTAGDLLQVGSLVFLQLLTEVEKEYQIQIEDDYWEYDKMNSVDAIADYVLESLKQKGKLA